MVPNSPMEQPSRHQAVLTEAVLQVCVHVQSTLDFPRGPVGSGLLSELALARPRRYERKVEGGLEVSADGTSKARRRMWRGASVDLEHTSMVALAALIRGKPISVIYKL